MKKIISLVNQKGGVGKTTLTFQMAWALNSLGANVLCIDLDPQANLTGLFVPQGTTIKGGIFSLLINSLKELKSMHTIMNVQDAFVDSGPIKLLPTNNDLSGFELTVASIHFPKQIILKKFLEQKVFDSFDVILLDGPPTLSLLMVNILCASEKILVPFRPDQFSLQGLGWLEQTLEILTDSEICHPAKIAGLIPNLVEGRRLSNGVSLEQIQLMYPQYKMYSSIANKSHIETAMREKKSVFHYSSQHYVPLQELFTQIAKDIYL